jgi:ABC-type antimicrobial peptide transport system permease subunit
MQQIKYYLINSFYYIIQNKGYALFYILGTALAFIFITFLVHIKSAMSGDYTPSVNSGRIIRVSRFFDAEGNVAPHISETEQKLLLDQLKEYEDYSLTDTHYANVITDANIVYSYIAFTNAGFWNMYSFDFIAGRPFTANECENRMKCVVITKDLSKYIFHTTNSIGKKINIFRDEFAVVGVVDNFSLFASPTNKAEIWMPYTLNPLEFVPEMRILFSQHTDMPSAKQKLSEYIKQLYNTKNVEINVNNLLTEKEMKNKAFMEEGGWAAGLLIFIFLLLPAVNIISLSRNNIYQRREEIAVRRTFGASKMSSFFLILFEYLLLAMIGSVIGILFAKPVISLLINMLFDEIQMMGSASLMPKINISLITGNVLPLVFVFIFISSALPIWLMVRLKVADVLKGGEK